MLLIEIKHINNGLAGIPCPTSANPQLTAALPNLVDLSPPSFPPFFLSVLANAESLILFNRDENVLNHYLLGFLPNCILQSSIHTDEVPRRSCAHHMSAHTLVFTHSVALLFGVE